MRTTKPVAPARTARCAAFTKLTALAAVAFAFSACCACRRTASTLPLVGTGWQLAQLYGESVSGTRDGSYTLVMQPDGRVSGRGECNNFTGGVTRAESSRSSGTLSMGDGLVSTKMMCLTGADREARYLRMLAEADAYNIDGRRLLLIKNGDVVAIFDSSAAPAANPPAAN